MKNLRKDNKGFSLVELIVVVLIMAIIAVALAPQVMKWVNNSRINADINAAGNIKTAVQAGVASYQANSGKISADLTYFINGKATDTDANKKLKLTSGTEPSAAGGKTLIQYIQSSLDDKETYATKADSAGFTINIDTKGGVAVTCGAQGSTLE